MDSFRKRTPGNAQPKAMDGFIRKPAGSGNAPALSHLRSNQRSATTVGPSSGRRVDGFGRRDGFYAPPRRSLQPGVQPRSPEFKQAQTPHVSTTLAKQLNLELPGDTKKKGRGKKSKAPLTRFQKIRRFTLRTAGATLVVALLGGGFLFTKGYFKLNQVFQGGSSAAALKSEVDPTLLKGEGDGRVNILLMGAGGEQHSGGNLTDTLLVASIDPVNNQAVLFSIPRDLWAKMPNNYVGNYNKINAAYESGKYGYLGKQVMGNADRKAVLAGFQGVDATVERIAGIPIHYNMLVDFKAFSQAIDTVGGVTVNAPEELRDPSMAWENGWNSVLAKKGINSFNGKQALNYVRSRHTSSDFARGERQRSVILALKEKTANLGTLTNPMKLSSLLSAFGNNVQSDISISDMTRMATIMKKMPSTDIQSVGLAEPGNSFVTTGNINGMSVVMPKAGLEDYTKIQAYIRSKLKDGYIARENANITILNGSGVAGLGALKADELKSYGYNVGVVDTAPTEDYTQTKIFDLSGGTKKYTINYLKKRLNVQTVGKQLPTGVVAGAANIVIILGNDAATTTNTGSSI